MLAEIGFLISQCVTGREH